MTSNQAGASRSLQTDDGHDDTAEALIGLLDGRASASHIAEVVARVWIEIDGALSPVLGKRGVVALFKRSLHRGGDAHGWLSGIQENSTAAIDFEMLQRTFAEQDPSEAFAAAAALLRAFCALLASLVGPSLTGRLLRPVLARSVQRHPPEPL